MEAWGDYENSPVNRSCIPLKEHKFAGWEGRFITGPALALNNFTGRASLNWLNRVILQAMKAQSENKPTVGRLIKKALAAPFVFLAAVIILIEDWLWDPLARLAAAIGQLPILSSIEAFIATLPAYVALFVFAVPAVLLVPVKVLAFYLVAHGQATLGLLTVVLAKVVGTAMVARIFTLTRPKLLSIKWFAILHDRVVAFKTHIYAIIKSTTIYKVVHQQRVQLSAAVRAWFVGRPGFWRKRFRGALKLSRRKKQTYP